MAKLKMSKITHKLFYKRSADIAGMLTITFMMFMFMNASLANSRDHIDREQQIKAVYLMHLVNYISWPNQFDMDGFVNICVYGNHPIGVHVKELEDKVINSMTLRISDNVQMDKVVKCNIVFVGEDLEKTFTLEDGLNIAKDALVVGEGYDYIDNGGMLSFCIKENKVKIVINQAKIKNSDLKISSKLLRIAELVK